MEKAQPPTPGKSFQLAESVQELRCAMEPLTTFTNVEVLDDAPPFNWVKITSSRMAEPTPRECSCSRTHRAHARGLFLAAYGEGWPKAITTTQMASQPAALAQEVEPKLEDTVHQQPSPLAGFAEIALSLHADNLP